MADPIATAVVRVIPDGALFRADLQKVVTRAVNSVVVPPIKVRVIADPASLAATTRAVRTATAATVVTGGPAAAATATAAAALTEEAAAATLAATAFGEMATAETALAAAAIVALPALKAQRTAIAGKASAATRAAASLGEMATAEGTLAAAATASLPALQAQLLAQEALTAATVAGATAAARAAAVAVRPHPVGKVASSAPVVATTALSQEAAAAGLATTALGEHAVAEGAAAAATAREEAAALTASRALRTERLERDRLTRSTIAGAEAATTAAAAATVATAAPLAAAAAPVATAGAATTAASTSAATAISEEAAAATLATTALGEMAGAEGLLEAAVLALLPALQAQALEQGEKAVSAGLAGTAVGELAAAEEVLRAAIITVLPALRLQRLEQEKLAKAVAAGAATARAAAVTPTAVTPVVGAVGAAAPAAAAATALSDEAAAAALAATALGETSAAEGVLAGATARAEAAALALSRALQAELIDQERVTAATIAGTEATGAAAAAARARASVPPVVPPTVLPPVVPPIGPASKKAAAGVADLTKESQALRGSIIGLSRVTPVTVFGLGIYGTAAIAAGYAIKGAIRSTADFEHQLNVFQATTGATAIQMQAVTEKAKALGADLSLPSTSAGDAAQAMTELAKAGLTVNDTLAGSTGVLQLAAAAQLDVGSAATFVATELNAFGLAGDQATHVADLLAGASIAAQGEIRDFGTAFAQASAVAKQADISIETTTGALTELAKAGLRGADGGTSLRTAILRLTPTTKQAAEFQKALGIQLDQNRTIGEQFPELLDKYKTALEGLTPIMRQQALTQIFGQDAYRAAAILIEGGSAALRRNTDAADQNGAANRLAQANAKGLAGAFNGLKSNLDTLGITLGDYVKGPLAGFVRGTSDGVTAVSDLVTALAELPDSLPDWLGGGGGKDKGDSGPAAAVKRLFTPLGTVVSDLDAFLTVVNQGGFVQFGETPKQALKRIEAEKKNRKNIAKAREAGQFGISGFLPSDDLKKQVESGRFGITDLTEPNKLTKAQKAARDAIKKLIEGAKKPAPLDISPPNKLAIAELNAQLADNLQAELAADKAIEAYFHNRLKGVQEGTDRYRAILAAERSAHANVAAVQGQINSEAKAATAAAEQAARDAAQRATDAANVAIGNARLAADAAGNQGKAEQVLIALLKKRVREAKANSQELLDAQIALKTELDKRRQTLAEQAKLAIELQTSILDTKLARAQTTPQIEDDVKVLQQQIAVALREQTAAQKLADAQTTSSEIRLKALLQVQEDERKIIGLREQIKELQTGGGGGFTLRELFQEAADEFNQFGSNIAAPGGILSAQDARAQFSLDILNSLSKTLKPDESTTAAATARGVTKEGLGFRPFRESGGAAPPSASTPPDPALPIASAQLTQAQQQTAYLAQIAAAVSHGGLGRGKVAAPVTGNRGRIGSLEAIDAIQVASIWGY